MDDKKFHGEGRIRAIDSIFSDPASPAWSSYLLQQLVETATPVEDSVSFIRTVEMHIGSFDPCNHIQSNLLKDLSIFTYLSCKGQGGIPPSELAWLVNAFDREQSNTRAAMIDILIDPVTLDRRILELVIDSLGTPPSPGWACSGSIFLEENPGHTKGISNKST